MRGPVGVVAGGEVVKRCNMLLAALAVIAGSAFEVHGAGLGDIDTIVVLYAENRSFDNLYGSFPGANGLPIDAGGIHAARPRRLGAKGTAAGVGRPYRQRRRAGGD